MCTIRFVRHAESVGCKGKKPVSYACNLALAYAVSVKSKAYNPYDMHTLKVCA